MVRNSIESFFIRMVISQNLRCLVEFATSDNLFNNENRLIELSNAENEAQNRLQTIKKWLVEVHYLKVPKPKGNQGCA
jgi:hypothetical protein